MGVVAGAQKMQGLVRHVTVEDHLGSTGWGCGVWVDLRIVV